VSKPWIHAESSARRFGGKPEDYISLHNLMDSSKGTIADSRHRALTHNSWFIAPDGPLERIFGVNLTNSDGRLVSVRELGEQHILEDFGNRFIPSAQDYLQEINVKEWMLRGKGAPPSFALIFNKAKKVVTRTITSWLVPAPAPTQSVQHVCGSNGFDLERGDICKACDTIEEEHRRVHKIAEDMSAASDRRPQDLDDGVFYDGATNQRNKFLID
jgi:hypothetical protein